MAAIVALGVRLAVAAPEIAVDVGHGLIDGGAVSARGRNEFDFNRDLAEQVQGALLARGFRVRPVNFDGAIRELTERPRAAAGADFFIAIHHDSVQAHWLQPWVWQGENRDYSDRYQGFSLFVSRLSPDLDYSLRCASILGASLRLAGFVPADHHADPYPGNTRSWADRDNGVYFYDRLVVLYRTTLPAVLFEAGVIKHRDEELALRDPQRQARMADALGMGLQACLGLARKPAVAGDDAAPAAR
ncbi:MAG: hypothetical protein RIR00_1801 [Pseudomonadota bacterium]